METGSHSSQLSLLLLAGQEMSTGQRAVICNLEGNGILALQWPCITDSVVHTCTYGFNGLRQHGLLGFNGAFNTIQVI